MIPRCQICGRPIYEKSCPWLTRESIPHAQRAMLCSDTCVRRWYAGVERTGAAVAKRQRLGAQIAWRMGCPPRPRSVR